MKGKAILALLSMSLALSMIIGHVAAVPYGTMSQVKGTPIQGVHDIWTLTSSPDRRIWGGTSGGYSGSKLFYYLPIVCNSTDKLVVVGNPGLEVYALTTSVCGNNNTINATNYSYFIYGGSYKANPEWYKPSHDAHLFKYVPDAGWVPGWSSTYYDNPYDFGPWHRILGGPGIAADSVLPRNTLIYKLSAGPCGKIYGGSGWDAPQSPSSNNYGDYAYFFVFDPITEKIVDYYFYPNATSVPEVLTGRDGNVYFIRQYDNPIRSVVSRYNPFSRWVTDILDTSVSTDLKDYVLECMTWSVDHNGNPRIYIGASEPNGGHLIQLDPTGSFKYWISGALQDPTVKLSFIRDLTTGIFSEEVYGVGYGQDSQGATHGYFFMYCQCKGSDPVWGYWNPSTAAAQGDPWIAGSPWTKMGPVDRLRTIVTGQEAQNGYCVSNQDPHVYMGAGVSGATLYSYLPLTSDLNLDQNVNILDISIAAKEFGVDPPGEQTATASPTPLNPLVLALVASVAIATVYKLGRSHRQRKSCRTVAQNEEIA